MSAIQKVKRLRTIIPVLLAGVCALYALTTFLSTKHLRWDSLKSQTDAGRNTRLNVGKSVWTRTDEKKGDFIFSVHADDLNDILNRLPNEEFPQTPPILLHNPFLCQDAPALDFIIYVHSSPVNWEKRNILRQTYANTKLFKNIRFKVIFLLGLSKRMGVQEMIKKEFDEHGDIVQGYFIDDYRNMTLKAVMGLNWISSHCSQAPFAIKVDDDTFLNIFEMIPLMERNSNRSLVMICPIWREGTMRVLRERKTCMKWCVSRREFRGDFYPRYCAGISYILSSALLQQLRKSVETTPYFWIDDVYVTGLLAQPMTNQIHYIDMMNHFSMSQDNALSQYTNASQQVDIFLAHVKDLNKFNLLWKALLSRLTAEQLEGVEYSAIRS